jgi:hypothetical protein
LIHGIREAAIPHEVVVRHPDARSLAVSSRLDPEIGRRQRYVVYRDQVDLVPCLAIHPEEVYVVAVVALLARP